MKVKSYLDIFVILFIALIGQSNLLAQSSQIDLELIVASEEGNVNRIRDLIEKGANVSAANDFGNTALMLASAEGYAEVVKELLKEGANVNAKDKNGFTALIEASNSGCVEVARELIKSGANVNATNSFGYTALMLASLWGYIEIVKELIEAGANINAIAKNGRTALMGASSRGSIEVENLLKAINAVEESGTKEEFIAQSDEIKNILINRWINLYKENRSKWLTDRLKMAEFYAKENEKYKIRELLSKLDIDRQKKSAEKFSDVMVKTGS